MRSLTAIAAFLCLATLPGVAKIPPIPQGKIQVQVIAKGYQTFGQTYNITEEEKTIQLTLNPPQPQYSAH
jgi:hypothetical protein